MAAAEFSGLVAQHRGMVQWSPDGVLLAVACGTRLTVRRQDSLEIVVSFTCVDKLEEIAWSPDSGYVLCALYQRAVVQCFAVHDPEWTCKVSEGLAGLAHAQWAPDSRHVVTVADFGLHLTVWSLVSGDAVSVPGAKLGARGVAFSPNGGRFLAVATRCEGRDAVEVLDGANEWALVTRFSPGTTDMAELSWSPDGSTIAVRESLLEYGVRCFSCEGTSLAVFQPYQNALGAKAMAWTPSGDLLAVGSYDEHVRLLHRGSWRPVADKVHSLEASPPETVFVERAVGADGAPLAAAAAGDDGGGENRHPNRRHRARQASSSSSKPDSEPEFITFETALASAGDLPSVPVDASRAEPRKGVGLLAWSADGRYLATRNDNMPTVVWVWDTERQRLQALLVLLAPVFSAKWDPVSTRLAVCTGGTRVYFWSPAGASWVDVPAGQAKFQLRGLRWHPQGDAVALLGRTGNFCVAYL